MIQEITKALTEQISAGTFTAAYPTVTAVRDYLPNYDLEQLHDLRITVLPRELEVATASRGTEDHAYGVAIVIAKRTGGTTQEVDDLLEFVEELIRKIRSGTLPESAENPWPAGISWKAVAIDPMWSQEHLSERRVFFTAVSLTYVGVLAKETL